MKYKHESAAIAPLRAARLSSLSPLVRQILSAPSAVPVRAGVVVGALVMGIVPPAAAEPFPAVFPLARLPGGDGSEGFVINGVNSVASRGIP
jgi:hypothetical protein